LLSAWLLRGEVGNRLEEQRPTGSPNLSPIARVVAGLFVSGLLSEKETAQRGDELGR
jgi:hypothetical protein